MKNVTVIFVIFFTNVELKINNKRVTFALLTISKNKLSTNKISPFLFLKKRGGEIVNNNKKKPKTKHRRVRIKKTKLFLYSDTYYFYLTTII